MNGKNSNPHQNNMPESVVKFIFGTFGLIFGGVGVTVLIFLWSQSFNEFGSPPLFFRIFGSFIALAFVLFGGGACFAAIFGGRMVKDRLLSITPSEQDQSTPEEKQPNRSLNYICPHCGAPLGSGIGVSPHGDVNCTFCKSWFNIHGT